MISITHVSDKFTWENYILQHREANFLQSWNWGQFHASLRKNIYYIQLHAENQIIGCAVIVAEKAKRGNYLTIAGGPLFPWNTSEINEIFDNFLSELKRIGRLEKSAFVRMRLQEEESPELHLLMKKHGLTLSPIHLTADLTIQLDLRKTEEELLNEMRKNTRYEVKKSQRENIAIVLSKNPAEINSFYQTQLEVATRQKFIPFSLTFLQKQFEAFLLDDQVLLIHAYQNSRLLASAFVIFYGNEAVYHYGISTPENAKLPGSYACQWAAILEAKRRGIARYNFWGVNPKEEINHRFAGVGLFKRGFGGSEVCYLPSYDLPLNWKYPYIQLFETVRKKMRRL